MVPQEPVGGLVLASRRIENYGQSRVTRARKGDLYLPVTASPILAGSTILVPAESYVQGVVTRSVGSGRVKGRAEPAIRIENLMLPSGKVVKMNPMLASVDSNDTDQKVVSRENEVRQGTSLGHDAATIASTGGAGAAIGGLADRSWKGAGIGAGVGSGVGLAVVLLTRGRELEWRQGNTIDVVFERPIPLDQGTVEIFICTLDLIPVSSVR